MRPEQPWQQRIKQAQDLQQTPLRKLAENSDYVRRIEPAILKNICKVALALAQRER